MSSTNLPADANAPQTTALTPEQEARIQALEKNLENATFSLPPLTDNSKTNARLAAMQAIYSHLTNPLDENDEEEIAAFCHAFIRARSGRTSEGEKMPFSKTLFTQLVAFYVQNQDMLTEQLAGHVQTQQKLLEIDQTVHAFLATAVTELFASPDTPSGVVIAETLDLSRAFVDDKTTAFMHGVLDGVVKAVR